MTDETTTETSLCKKCKYKFRRVYIPLRPEEYLDEEGNQVLGENANIVIINQCLLNGMDIDAEITIECNHYAKKSKKDNNITLFKHLK